MDSEVKHESFFENNIFTFENSKADCAADITENFQNKRMLTYKCKHLEQKVRFAFTSKNGLIRLRNNGSIEENNVLGKLMALNANNENEVKGFFLSNGFFFTNKTDNVCTISSTELNNLICHIKGTVELMSAVGAVEKDYQKILKLSLYLLFSPRVKIKYLDDITYLGCLHKFTNNIENGNFFHSAKRKREETDGKYYLIDDTITTPKQYSLSTELCSTIIEGTNDTNGYSDWYFKRNIEMFCFGENEDRDNRIISDFLFHYEMEVGIPDGFEYGYEMQYYSLPNLNNFSDKLKAQLLSVAKIIVSEEINSNLGGIHPVYDGTSMTPSWKIDSLISAIYFSIFYLKPELELYRKCANPRCNNYFLVSSTATRNKYCSDECRNRMSQSMYRKRKKEKATA